MSGRRLSKEKQIEKWEMLEAVQDTFPYSIQGLLLFAQTIINTMIVGNPSLCRMQADILKFLFSGNLYRMIMAQRGQAKTTLSAIYCAFMLIHKPAYRIIVFSQNGKRAKEIAGWVIRIFETMEFLEFMLPDTYGGDRSSIEAFEIHWALRGAGASPSVACYSIESGAQGARADIILADDIESLQNSQTVGGREKLIDASKEFESINQYGDIIYLGTPQTGESIYYTLSTRGYDIRIWSGRYPTPEELPLYGEHLAPIIRRDLEKDPTLQVGGGLTGNRGKPTCPEMYSEEQLNKKELSQGAAKFNLQFMLSTGLMDEQRHPLKLSNLVVSNFNSASAPVMPIWTNSKATLWDSAPRVGSKASDKLYMAMNVEYEHRAFDNILMAIDPSGGGANGDEMGYAVLGQLGATIYILQIGGIKGGWETAELEKLVFVAKFFKVNSVWIENNYGNGAHEAALAPLFQKHYPCIITCENVQGQKEVRIIDTIEPILSAHRIVVSQDAIMHDIKTIQQYTPAKRMRYSWMHQLSHITKDRDSLGHDDRLDALAMAVAQLTRNIDYDQAAFESKKKAHEEQRLHETLSNRSSYVEYMQANQNLDAVAPVMKKGNMLSGVGMNGTRKKSGMLKKRRW